MTLPEFITENLYNGDTIINALVIGFLFTIMYDFYHTLTSAIFTFFKRK